MQLDIVCNDTKYLPIYANDTDACMDLKVKIEEGTYCFYFYRRSCTDNYISLTNNRLLT